MVTFPFKELLRGVGKLFKANLLGTYTTKRYSDSALGILEQVDFGTSEIYINEGYSETDRLAMVLPYDEEKELVIRELDRVIPQNYRVFVLGFYKSGVYPSSDSVAVLDTVANVWFAGPLACVPLDKYTRRYYSTMVAKISKVKRNTIALRVAYYVYIWFGAETQNVTYKLSKIEGPLLEKLQTISELLKLYSV